MSLMDIPHTICLLAGINVTGGGGADDVTMGELGQTAGVTLRGANSFAGPSHRRRR